jgi:DNA-binding transcriptional ArsR family regulator
VSEDSVSYALRLLRTAGLLVTRKQGRVVYNRLADDFPAPLRDHCLHQLIALTHTGDDADGADSAELDVPSSCELDRWTRRCQ